MPSMKKLYRKPHLLRNIQRQSGIIYRARRKPESDTGPEPDAEPESQTQGQSQMQNQSQTQGQSHNPSRTKIRTQPEPDSGSGAEPDPVQSQNQTLVQSQNQTPVQGQTSVPEPEANQSQGQNQTQGPESSVPIARARIVLLMGRTRIVLSYGQGRIVRPTVRARTRIVLLMVRVRIVPVPRSGPKPSVLRSGTRVQDCPSYGQGPGSRAVRLTVRVRAVRLTVGAGSGQSVLHGQGQNRPSGSGSRVVHPSTGQGQNRPSYSRARAVRHTVRAGPSVLRSGWAAPVLRSGQGRPSPRSGPEPSVHGQGQSRPSWVRVRTVLPYGQGGRPQGVCKTSGETDGALAHKTTRDFRKEGKEYEKTREERRELGRHSQFGNRPNQSQNSSARIRRHCRTASRRMNLRLKRSRYRDKDSGKNDNP